MYKICLTMNISFTPIVGLEQSKTQVIVLLLLNKVVRLVLQIFGNINVPIFQTGLSY